MFLRGSVSFCAIATFSVAFGQEPSQFPWHQAPRPALVQKDNALFAWDAAPATLTATAATKSEVVKSPFPRTEDVERSNINSNLPSNLPRVARLEKSNSDIQLVSADQPKTTSKPRNVQVRAPTITAQANSTPPLKGAFKTESYTAPLAPSEQLFGGLKIADSYQNAGGVRLEETMSDSFATAFTWASPVFSHRPLYFEQPNLERYGLGHRKYAQPFFSGLHFYGSVFLMPYKMMTQHPFQESYTLGHQRPGSCVSYQRGTILGL